jgi:hypothetical protein
MYYNTTKIHCFFKKTADINHSYNCTRLAQFFLQFEIFGNGKASILKNRFYNCLKDCYNTIPRVNRRAVLPRRIN